MTSFLKRIVGFVKGFVFGGTPSENYGFGEVSKKRGEGKRNAAYMFIVAFILHYVWTVPRVQLENVKRTLNQSELIDDDLHMVHTYLYVFTLPMMFVGIIIAKFLQCSFVLVEEVNHRKSRHNNSYKELIRNCFQIFLTWSSLVGFLCLLSVMYLMRSVDNDLFYQHYAIYWPIIVTSVCVSIVVNYLFGFKTLSVVELSEIHESSSINVAQGLAWSYYTGYLKIILKDLEKTINKHETWKKEYQDGNLPCKLFAIVPLNCVIPSKLGESKEKHVGIQFESKLPILYVDRAGVKDRPYVNSVYRIDNGKGESHFAICEYVTVIDTLHQMPLCTDFNPKMREEQCRLLVRKLRELIDSDDKCRGKCEIVTLSGEERPLLRDVLLDKIHESRVQINN